MQQLSKHEDISSRSIIPPNTINIISLTPTSFNSFESKNKTTGKIKLNTRTYFEYPFWPSRCYYVLYEESSLVTEMNFISRLLACAHNVMRMYKWWNREKWANHIEIVLMLLLWQITFFYKSISDYLNVRIKRKHNYSSISENIF